MNRPQLVRNSFLTIAVMLGLFGLSASAQTDAANMQLSARERVSIKTAVARPAATTFWAVTQDFEGNFDNVDAHMATFTKEAKAQSIVNANPVGILVLYEDPTGKSQFRMGIGIALTRRVEVKAPLKVEQMSFSETVHYTHVGPYGQLGKVHEEIATALKKRPKTAAKGAAAARVKNTSWPVVLKLLNDPKKVRAQQLRTELIVPIK